MSNAPFAVIMAGGSGTRFWPVSRSATPKQLVRIVGDATMIQATVARLQPLIPPERVLIVTTAALAAETRRQLPMLKPEHVIAEPVGRDTAACVALAALVVQRLSPGATMIMLPADAVITPADAFQRALAVGADEAAKGGIVTFGIPPRFAATGYGYIQVAGQLRSESGGEITVSRVERFVEKPDAKRAAEYVAAGCYRWNAGIFAWRADVVLAELERHCQWLTDALAPVGVAWGTPRFAQVLDDVYQPLQRISIDYALIEKAKDIRVVTGGFAWDDVGSWDALYDHLPRDPQGVAARGEVVALECRDSLLVAESGQTVTAVGLTGITVVATRDAVLVLPKGKGQMVKNVVDKLKESGRSGLI
ncbi:MAG: NTP transferase domain-containing protein [Planctomycetes bacterium]|nr:NTP transferase domain-containing protein [Planctomycetota bacterium]